jgi:hypothetical protein
MEEDAMRLTLVKSAWTLGFVSLALAACSHTHDRTVQSRPYEPTAAEQRAEERRADERRAEERRAEDRRAEERAEDRRAEDRRVEERRERERSMGGGPREAVSKTTPTVAVASIAAARCDRELRCKHIGTREKYRTRGDCMADMQRDKREDLNGDACPAGIREKELNDCVQAIHDEDCGNPLDAITRLNACRSGNLCLK